MQETGFRQSLVVVAHHPGFWGSIKATAMPAGRPDETKISHYFAPNSNWVNSPLTLPDAIVTITGNVTGATAEATGSAKTGKFALPMLGTPGIIL